MAPQPPPRGNLRTDNRPTQPPAAPGGGGQLRRPCCRSTGDTEAPAQQGMPRVQASPTALSGGRHNLPDRQAPRARHLSEAKHSCTVPPPHSAQGRHQGPLASLHGERRAAGQRRRGHLLFPTPAAPTLLLALSRREAPSFLSPHPLSLCPGPAPPSTVKVLTALRAQEPRPQLDPHEHHGGSPGVPQSSSSSTLKIGRFS